jgi:predicted Zn-ribbon and HTH transcriptional regulator
MNKPKFECLDCGWTGDALDAWEECPNCASDNVQETDEPGHED